MRAHRTLAVLATAGALLAATASVALVGPAAATAAPTPATANPAASTPPSTAYPPPKFDFTVNKPRVKIGQNVRLSGTHFTPGKPVTITIKYKKFPTAKPIVITVKPNKNGMFVLSVKLVHEGYVAISAFGPPKNYKWVYVIVIDKKGHPHVVVAQAAAGTHKTGTVTTVSNPLISLESGPLGLAAAKQGAAQAGSVDTNLVANSKDLTPTNAPFPIGTAGAGLAAVGLALTVLAFRRRRTDTDS